MLEKFLIDIETALDKKAYLPALALALSLPDICGRIEKNHGKLHYAKWFDKWVSPYHYDWPKEMYENTDNPDVREILQVKFDGTVCFHLRNAFFHSGNTNLKNLNGYEIEKFELHYNGKSDSQFDEIIGMFIEEDGTKKLHYKINVIGLINNIVEGCRRFIKNNPKDTLEYDYIDLVDWDK